MPWAAIINLLVSFAVFGLLARLCPCNPKQPRFLTRELADNSLYWLINFLFYGALSGLALEAGVSLAFPGHARAALVAVTRGYGWAARAPLAVQAVLVIVALDIVQYWLHRAFHHRALWPFHAIHHSAEQLDWTTTYRIHPVNFLVYSAGALALVKLLGFSPLAYAVVGPFNLVAGALVHANLNWTFGPFRYVIASPVFHRWHHVRDPAVHDKNFAPTFPMLDLVFGTFYMPKGVLPADYGADGAPPHLLGQMAWPFLVIAERLGLGRKPDPDRAPA